MHGGMCCVCPPFRMCFGRPIPSSSVLSGVVLLDKKLFEDGISPLSLKDHSSMCPTRWVHDTAAPGQPKG